MPELPEVETIKRQLTPKLKDQVISRVYFHPDFGNTLKFRNKKDLESLLPGRKIAEIDRVAKNLVFTLNDQNKLIFHLKIYGRLVVNQEFKAPVDHTHRFSLYTENGEILRFFDKSNLADMRLLTEEEYKELVSRLGPEPFKLSERDFYEIIKSAKFPRIKDAILDQSVVSGIGNIYADEALFRAKISPLRKPADLSELESSALLKGIKESLDSGLAHRGTSIESYYDTQGVPGENQNYLLMYGRSGKNCLNCGNPVVLTELGGRRTYYCPICQPESQLTLF